MNKILKHFIKTDKYSKNKFNANNYDYCTNPDHKGFVEHPNGNLYCPECKKRLPNTKKGEYYYP